MPNREIRTPRPHAKEAPESTAAAAKEAPADAPELALIAALAVHKTERWTASDSLTSPSHSRLPRRHRDAIPPPSDATPEADATHEGRHPWRLSRIIWAALR